ncbi:MAG: uroporphyrinogen decarboxylase [Thermoguttaceae bacterium]
MVVEQREEVFAWERSPMMLAARGEVAPRIPVWMMRQAGRYMKEYRDVRERVGFLELCKTPQLAAEVMLTAVERLNVDAAIIFSDILTILEPLGLPLHYAEDRGPVIETPIRTASAAANIHELRQIDQLGYVVDVVRETRRGLSPSLPLIGFAGAPFTLAAYAVEGGSSRDFRHVKAFMMTEPHAWETFMRRLAVSVATLLNAQIAAGVQLVQIFDSWAGCLSPVDYAIYAAPYSRMVMELLTPGTPVIHFVPGNPSLLPLVAETGGNIIGVDWRVALDVAWATVGHSLAVQGNLDPTVLLTNPEVIRRHVQHCIKLSERRAGYIFNLGHGVLQQTPVENAIAMVEAVHEFGTMVGN